jgi:hypothetical protein
VAFNQILLDSATCLVLKNCPELSATLYKLLKDIELAVYLASTKNP